MNSEIFIKDASLGMYFRLWEWRRNSLLEEKKVLFIIEINLKVLPFHEDGLQKSENVVMFYLRGLFSKKIAQDKHILAHIFVLTSSGIV